MTSAWSTKQRKLDNNGESEDARKPAKHYRNLSGSSCDRIIYQDSVRAEELADVHGMETFSTHGTNRFADEHGVIAA